MYTRCRPGAQGRQKRASDPMKLKLQPVVSCHEWVLETKPAPLQALHVLLTTEGLSLARLGLLGSMELAFFFSFDFYLNSFFIRCQRSCTFLFSTSFAHQIDLHLCLSVQRQQAVGFPRSTCFFFPFSSWYRRLVVDCQILQIHSQVYLFIYSSQEMHSFLCSWVKTPSPSVCSISAYLYCRLTGRQWDVLACACCDIALGMFLLSIQLFILWV